MSSSVSSEVVLIRKRLNAERKALPSHLVSQKTTQALTRLKEQFEVNTSRNLSVAVFHAQPWELSLKDLGPWMGGLGWKLHFPRIDGKKMEFVESQFPSGLNDNPDWEQGGLGIWQPHSRLPAVEPTQLDTIFVPGVAFSEQGGRIGMGAGYYDRYLKRAPQALRIAVTFDFQLLPVIPQESWDEPVHWIFTENRVWKL